MTEPVREFGRASTKAARSGIRSRFIAETTKLMREHGADGVSTRLICDAVGVTPPSLYHHFGDFKSLQDTVVDHAFAKFLEKWTYNSNSPDPITRIRNGWDTHVAFSRDEPTLYAIIAKSNVDGNIHSQILSAHRTLVEDFREIEQSNRLKYSPEVAAQIFTASCLGAASMIVLEGGDIPVIDGLSHLMREDVLRNLLDVSQLG